MNKLDRGTVQHTLCIPLAGRMIAAQKYPELFPDKDAERIVRELGIDLSGNALYRLQYMWMNCLIRQYDLASEVEGYLAGHPSATVVEMGAGLSCLRRQMGNETNPWYCLDMENVIELREKHVPKGIREHNVVCDLNDFSWFDEIDFNPARGIVFVAGGLFYYFEKARVQHLITAMASRFPGGLIVFDAVSPLGLKGIKAEVKMGGNDSPSYFCLDNPVKELESWSPNICNVREENFHEGYLKTGYEKTLETKALFSVTRKLHMRFLVCAEFTSDDPIKPSEASHGKVRL